LIFILLLDAPPFSVSKLIWYNLIRCTEDGWSNLPYAPSVMYMIEMVTGIIFKKDKNHLPYQVKNWHHIRRNEVLKPYMEPESPPLAAESSSSKDHK
jgi:hypothetical protein